MCWTSSSLMMMMQLVKVTTTKVGLEKLPGVNLTSVLFDLPWYLIFLVCFPLDLDMLFLWMLELVTVHDSLSLSLSHAGISMCRDCRWVSQGIACSTSWQSGVDTAQIYCQWTWEHWCTHSQSNKISYRYVVVYMQKKIIRGLMVSATRRPLPATMHAWRGRGYLVCTQLLSQ